MGETLSSYVNFQIPLFPKYYSWTTFELLLVALTSTLFIWYLQFQWRRRRLYEHASKLPGPFALPLIGSALQFIGNPYVIFSNIMMMFNKHPGIFKVWYGPRLFYAVSDPKYYETLLSSNLRKEDWYRYAEPLVGHGLFSAPLDTWKRHRKIIMPTFNQKILDSFVEIYSEQSNIFVEQLKNHAGKEEFDIFHVLSRCTLDVICETAMGVKVNAQTTDVPFTKWADKFMEIVFLRIFVFWYHFDAIFNLLPVGAEHSDLVEKMRNYSRDVIREKKKAYDEKQKQLQTGPNVCFEEEPKRKAFLDYLIELSSHENSKFTEQELIDEVNTFIIAGSDTTASTNSFAFIMLGLYQDLQEKVYQEVIDVVGSTRSVEPADLPRLMYMERFIKETLRLFPVAAFIVRAIDQDVDLGDYVFCGGTSVVFGILRTHTNEEYWPHPFKFDPDRFLPEEVAKRHPCAYVPFSYGPRNCVGGKYATMAMKTVLATVIRRYKIHTSYKNIEDIKLKANLVLRPKDGYKVSLELR